MIVLYILGSLYIVFHSPDLDFYSLVVFLNSMCTAAIDTIAEGLSSSILKKSHHLVSLKKTIITDEPVQEENDMKSFGNFAVIRLFFKMVMVFLGGTFSKQLSIHFVYAISSVYSVIFLVYVLFFFSEVKQKQVWVGCKKLWNNLAKFLTILVKPRILLPFILMVLVSCSPSLFDLSKYVLINIGKTHLDIKARLIF